MIRASPSSPLGSRRARRSRARRPLRLGASALLLALLPGCYLGHAAAGQLRLLRARRPVESLLRDPDTSAELRARLRLSRDVLDFARRLGLDVGGRYTSYAEWPGDRLVTVVVATRPGELDPAPFDFPIVGALPYKGFFDAARAEREAERLRGRGLDTCLAGVPAYSTLGWFDDPLTGPMLRRPEGELVEMILHELVHATVFAADAARFNEGLASFVAGEATLAFYAEREGGDGPAAARERRRQAAAREVTDVLLELREQLGALYRDGSSAPGAREGLAASARTRLAALQHGRREGEQAALHYRLNDACLALTGTYHLDRRRWAEALAVRGGDLGALLRDAARAAREPDPLRVLLRDSLDG